MRKNNAGRKPIDDKKVTVNLFVKASVIEKLGGKEALQSLCYELINNKLK